MKALLHFLLIFCLFAVACTSPDSDLQLAGQVMEQHPDSALHVLQRTSLHKIPGKANRALYALLKSQAMDKNDIKSESDSLTAIATDYFDADEPERAGFAWFYHSRTANNRGDAKEQADHLLKAQEYAEMTNNYKLHALVYGDKGIMYRTQQQYDSSICYYKKAYLFSQKAKDLYNSILILIYTGGDFVRAAQIDSGLSYFLKAEKLSHHLNDKAVISALYRNIGSAYLKKKDLEHALAAYRKVPLTGISLYDSNKWLLLANVFIQLRKDDSTLCYLNRVRNHKILMPNYFDLLIELQERKGNYKQALSYAKDKNTVKDSLNDDKLNVSFAGLEKKYKYQELQLSNKGLIIKDKQKSMMLLLLLLALSFVVLGVLFWRLKVRKTQLKMQKQLFEIAKSFAQTEKEKFEKEHENNLILEKQVKLQNILMLNIEQHRKNAIKKPSLASGKEHEIQATFYEELIACMDLEYNDISHRLKHQFPSLTQQDILICCLLLAGFDTGMMASVMDVKIDSMRTRRTRLRTKLNLSNSDKLVDYLSSF